LGEYKDKAQGKTKEMAGKLTGDKKMEWEGKAQNLKGKVEGAGKRVRQGPTAPPEEPREPTAPSP
jgi:uncharacterized protein YjbJ (UPF0337 family)